MQTLVQQPSSHSQQDSPQTLALQKPPVGVLPQLIPAQQTLAHQETLVTPQLTPAQQTLAHHETLVIPQQTPGQHETLTSLKTLQVAQAQQAQPGYLLPPLP